MNKSWTNCEQIVNILWTNYERVRQNAQKKNKCSIDYCAYCTNAGNIWKIIEQMFSSKWRTRTSVLVKLHKLIEQAFVNSEYCRKYGVGFVHNDCGKLCGNCVKPLKTSAVVRKRLLMSLWKSAAAANAFLPPYFLLFFSADRKIFARNQKRKIRHKRGEIGRRSWQIKYQGV